jgi:hypothetical protein
VAAVQASPGRCPGILETNVNLPCKLDRFTQPRVGDVRNGHGPQHGDRLVGDREQLAKMFGGPMLPVFRGFLSDAAKTTDRYPDREGVVLYAATSDAGYEGHLTFDGMRRFDPATSRMS